VKRCKDCKKLLIFWDLCYECEVVRFHRWALRVAVRPVTMGNLLITEDEARREVWRESP